MDSASFKTPIGSLEVKANTSGVCSIQFKNIKRQSSSTNNIHLKKAVKELKEYFKGERKTFSLKTSGEGTAFQRKVWKSLENIPYGKVSSYSDIARNIKKPKAVRAVGSANKRNPLPIIIPCHRVIGKSGEMTGYNFGLKRKKWLLEHEASA